MNRFRHELNIGGVGFFFFLVEEKWVDCIYICMDRYESYQFEYRTRYIDFSKIEILPLSRDFEPDLVSNLVCFALQQEKRFFFFFWVPLPLADAVDLRRG